MLSSTMQRKNKPPPSVITTEETPSSKPIIASTNIAPTRKSDLTVATVRRNLCGTSPFDKHWLNLDCCGLFCAGLTYFLHLYGVFVVCDILIPPWFSYNGLNGVPKMSLLGMFHILAFTSIAALAVYSHFRAMTTDPGAVPPDAEPPRPSTPLANQGNDEALERTGKRLCRRCKTYKPKRAHHCSICRRCIVKMDHHCPWVNNCVGIGNHKFFLLFIFYTSLSCVYSMTLLLWRFFGCTMTSSSVRCLDNPSQLLHMTGLMVEALLFGLFTCCMMCDQWGVVTTNVTAIDRLKGDLPFAFDDYSSKSTNTSLPSAVNEVFGGKYRFELNWLSPLNAVSFPPTIRDEVMGFCRPCIGGSFDRRNIGPDIV